MERIEQLQINDWVYIKDKDLNIYGKFRVEGIEKHEEGYGIVVSRRQLVFFDDCVEPIPITTEILNKNGWRFDEIDGTYYNSMNVYGRKAPFSIFDGVAINYVHQLQRALRLVGLNDLANNFTI